MGLSQPRACLVDMRQNLRPVKRQSGGWKAEG
jgi:hypothetical protein